MLRFKFSITYYSLNLKVLFTSPTENKQNLVKYLQIKSNIWICLTIKPKSSLKKSSTLKPKSNPRKFLTIKPKSNLRISSTIKAK